MLLAPHLKGETNLDSEPKPHQFQLSPLIVKGCQTNYNNFPKILKTDFLITLKVSVNKYHVLQTKNSFGILGQKAFIN